MTKSYDEFVALRENGKLSMAEIMKIDSEKDLLVNMTVDEVRTLVDKGLLQPMVASVVIKCIKRQQEDAATAPKRELVATK